MSQDESRGRRQLIGPAAATALARPAGRGLSRPALPPTRHLEPRDLIAVDIDERMDEAAAIEAAAPAGESRWLRIVRAVFVALAGLAVWGLLPPERHTLPPIALPLPLQPDDVVLPPARREAERRAVADYEKVGPHAALDDLRSLVASGESSHAAWILLLTVLQRLDLDAELLDLAEAYGGRHPDRLEAAHFIAEGLLRQPISAHMERDGFLGDRVSPRFRDRLDAARNRLDQALALLDGHAADWPDAGRRSWRDALLLDAAAITDMTWRCENAPFASDRVDEAVGMLGRLDARDAANAKRLRIDIYRRLREKWPWFTAKRRIGGVDYSATGLDVEIDRLRAELDGAPTEHQP